MTKQTVNVGNNANDGSGDAARTAFTKINQNFNDLYGAVGNATTPVETALSLGSPGIGQSLQIVTNQRSLNTTYKNTTGRTIFIYVLIYANFGAGARLFLYVNGVPVVEDYRPFGDSSPSHRWLIMPIPDTASYSISIAGTVNSASIDRWTELR